MKREIESRSFTYTLTEEGDLLFSGLMPDYPYASAAPWYEERIRIRRVVAGEGSRVGANAFTGSPVLRIADLTGVTEIADRAFCDCGRLASLVLSPTVNAVASTAFGGCHNLFHVDFAGDAEALEVLLAEAALPTSELILRTPPVASGETVASGEVGGGSWSLTSDGLLTVEDAEIPDCHSSQDAPWHPYRERIAHVFTGAHVTRIGAHAFHGLPSLEGVTVAGRTAIGQSAFATCPRLAEAAVFATVTEIEPYAFAGSMLKVALMPPSLRRIPVGLYDSCRALRTLVLPPVGITSAARFTDGCRSLLRVVFLGTKEEYRALCERGLTHAGRASFLPHPPMTNDLDAAIRAAEGAEAAAAEALDTALAEMTTAGGRLAEMPELIDRAEATYMTAETRRTGFAEPLDEEEPRKKRTPRRESRHFGWRFKKKYKLTYAEEERLVKKWRRRTAEATEDETRRERDAAHLATETMQAVCHHLDLALRLATLAERNTVTARRRAEAAVRAGEALYPYAREKREIAATLAEIETAPAALQAETLRYATVRAATYRDLLPYHRYAEVKEGIRELTEVVTGVKTESEEHRTADTYRPRILVAGGDPTEDPATDACMRALYRAGAIPIAAPLSLLNKHTTTPLIPKRNHHDPLAPKKEVDRGFDALVICGEGTVDPFLYNERRESKRDTRGSAECTPLEAERDIRDYDLYSAFYRYGKPILGINRGCLMINVAQGGTLYRELGDKRLPHHFNETKDITGKGKDTVHELRIDPASFLFAIYRPTIRPVRVYSRHQSAIRELGRELLPIARTMDETIEAFAHRSLPVAGVQFSVERMIHPTHEVRSPINAIPDDGRPVFDWFLTLCRNIRRRPLVSSANGRFSTGEEE